MGWTVPAVPEQERVGDEEFRQAFDARFYRERNADLDFGRTDPLAHYLARGWREGRDPAPWFSTAAYLAAYPDVRAAGIDPFLHYLRFGRWEGRRAGVRSHDEPAPAASEERAPKCAAVAAQNEGVPERAPDPDLAARIASAIAPHFDAAHYLATNPDVAEAGLDPVAHYVAEGWREGRDPAPDFSTRYYLETNPDVAAQGLNPFWHYVVAGREENRLAVQPGGYKAEILKRLAPLEAMVADWRLEPREATPGDRHEITAALRRALRRGTGRLILAFAHDDYRANVGGVQLCVLREEQAALASGHSYVALSPAQPLPRMARPEEADGLALDVALDGAAMGTLPAGEAIAAIARARGERDAVSLVVHSLLGHAPETVAAAARALAPSDAWFWLHDNFSICPSYALLRNGITFCGAPAPESPGCGICVYGAERRRHLPRMRALFDAVPFTVVAPSKPELDLWSARSGLTAACSRVLPHLELDWSGARRRPRAERDGPVRVAFAGVASTVKGWPAFRRLAERGAGRNGTEFHYFGIDDPGTPAIFAHRVAVTPGRRMAMRDAMIEAGIDLFLHWSACPETFSFVAHEALAAGAAIVTHTGTGNVAALVRETGRGRVLEGDAALDAFFADGDARALALGNRLTAERGAGFRLGRMTIDLIEGGCADGDPLLHQLHV